MCTKYTQKNRGFTLAEVVIASAVFLIIAVGIYQVYTSLFRTITASRTVLLASALATEQFEIARNMPYDDVGVVGSIPNGLIPNAQTLTRDGVVFNATTTIRNVDDPFDGTIGGSPNDTSPADYKLMQIEIDCTTCRTFTPLTFTTRVAPKNLEFSSGNGALFVRVFDANGLPVQDADVHVEYTATTSPVVINDVTDQNGLLQLIDIPPAETAYSVSVSKSGYSSDQTYAYGSIGSSTPSLPHATVLAGQVTQLSFTIDVLSSLTITSVTNTCEPVGSVSFDLEGAKLIATTPDVRKYDQSFSTDASGNRTINNLEWDTYALDITDGAYDLAGLIPLLPPTLAPDSHMDLSLVVTPSNPDALLVTVKDAATQLPISDAIVTLDDDEEQTTGRGFLTQTDWSGGSGQELYEDETEYWESEDIETNDPDGVLTLNALVGSYDADGWLISSIFDTGSASNFYRIMWQPTDQPTSVGTDSVRFQIATNDELNASTTWSYVGPDNTSGSYFTVANQNIGIEHTGKRYFRYKIFLRTDDTDFTPTVSDISFVFTSACVPPGQVVFGNVGNGAHTVAVERDGYQPYESSPFALTGYFTSHEVLLNPE